jgi:hypothetical protein
MTEEAKYRLDEKNILESAADELHFWLPSLRL